MKYWGLLILALLFAAPAVVAQQPDPLGTATGTVITCPHGKFPGSICYDVFVSGCLNTSGVNVYLKVTEPISTPVGVVLFSYGGTVQQLYEQYTYGTTALDNVLAAGYILVQISFGGPFTKTQLNGWEVGSGGPRAAACNYATAVQWVHQNLAANGLLPVCVTGNSNGAVLIGYGLGHYGMDSLVTFAEMTSGPSYSRLDLGCIDNALEVQTPCDEGVLGYSVGISDAENFIDPTWGTSPGPICSEALKTHSTMNLPTFKQDSILSSTDTQLSYQTFVNFVYGGQDFSSAPNQGNAYYSLITSSKRTTCVLTAAHSLPDSLAGATQVASDIIANCHLPSR
jgi:hypothetical protein